MKLPLNKWLLLTLLWFVAGIYALIFREAGDNGVPPFPHFDKFAHCFLFLMQTWLLAQAWIKAHKKPPYLFLFVFGLLYAIGSELAQHFFTQTRQGDIFDVLADMLGVCLALQIAKWRAALCELEIEK